MCFDLKTRIFKGKTKFILLLLMLPIFCFATLGDIEVEPLLNNLTFNNVGVSVFDLDNPQEQPIIFNATASNISTAPIGDYSIRISMNWRGNVIIDELIVEPVPGSPWYSIQPDVPLFLTNRDIIVNQSANFNAQTNLSFNDIRSANPEFEDYVIQSGLIPDGNYEWFVQFIDSNDQPLSEMVTIAYTIATPIDIMLTTPGSPLGMDVYYSMSNRPTFIWYSNLENFTFEIYQVPSDVETADDIETLDPIFTLSDIMTNSLTFPDESESLLSDRTYAWRVSAETSVPNGLASETRESPFYLFRTMTSAEQQATQEAVINFIMQLNIPQAEELIAIINDGYNISEINFENSPISMDALIDLLDQIQAGTITFSNITID